MTYGIVWWEWLLDRVKKVCVTVSVFQILFRNNWWWLVELWHEDEWMPNDKQWQGMLLGVRPFFQIWNGFIYGEGSWKFNTLFEN